MRTTVFTTLAAVLLIGPRLDACVAQEPGRLCAGTAKADITPPAGHFDGVRTLDAKDIHDPLLARVVVLRDGKVSLAIVSVDLLLFSSQKVVTEAKKKWNVDHVILSSIHTHSGMNPRTGGTTIHPKAMLDAAWTRKGDPGEVLDFPGFSEDPWYASTEEKIIAAIGQAAKNTFPAHIGAGKGPLNSAYLAHNRRLVKPDGTVTMMWANPDRRPTRPVDPTVRVIRIDDDAGVPRAILVHYACHAVTLMGCGRISADFPGAMAHHIESELGPKCIAMFLQGAQGDIDPYDVALRTEHGFQIARQSGISLAKGALRVAQDMGPQKNRGASIRAKESLLSIAHRGSKTKVSEVGLLTVVINNEIALATIPGEPFIQHQLDLAAKSPIPNTLLLGLAYCGKGTPFALYIPTVQAIKEGGYGAVECSFLESGAGERLVEEALTSIKGLKDNKSGK